MKHMSVVHWLVIIQRRHFVTSKDQDFWGSLDVTLEQTRDDVTNLCPGPDMGAARAEIISECVINQLVWHDISLTFHCTSQIKEILLEDYETYGNPMLKKNKEPLPRRMVKCSEVQDFIESTSSLPLEQLDGFEALGLVSAAKNQKKRMAKAGKNTVARKKFKKF